MTETPDTDDVLGNLLLFALVSFVAIGATLTGFRVREWLREQGEEKERGR